MSTEEDSKTQLSTPLSSNSGRERSAKKRTQVSLACDACRAAKVKCSGTTPCARCLRQDIQCSFDERRDIIRTLKQDKAKYRESLASLRHALTHSDTSTLDAARQLAKDSGSLDSFLSRLPIRPHSPNPAPDGVPNVPNLSPDSADTELVNALQDLRLKVGSARFDQVVQHLNTSAGPAALQPEETTPTADNKSSVPYFGVLDEWHYMLQRPSDSYSTILAFDQYHASGAETNSSSSSKTVQAQLVQAGMFGTHHDAEATSSFVQSSFDKSYEHHQAPSTQPPWHLNPGGNRGFGNLPFSSAVKANHYPPDIQQRQLRNFGSNEYLVKSLALYEDCPLANLFYSFQDAALQMISRGTPARIIFGSNDVDVELFFRDRQLEDPFDVYSWACEILKTLGDFDLYALLASVALWGGLMRWNLMPTAENYARMPGMIRPTMRQRFVPHNVVVDLAVHHGVRDALITRYRDWFTPATAERGAISVSWPYSLQSAVQPNPLTGRLQLTSAFVEHANDPRNWSMRECAKKHFPEIEAMGFRFRPNTFET